MELLPKDSEFHGVASQVQEGRGHSDHALHVHCCVVLVQRFGVSFVNLNTLTHLFPERTYVITIKDK